MWRARCTGENHLLGIDLGRSTAISMIRIWNYNKNRIHSYRGARYIELSLDDRVVFKGEIKRAPGSTDDMVCLVLIGALSALSDWRFCGRMRALRSFCSPTTSQRCC